jgi:protein-tyrosine phosphatase
VFLPISGENNEASLVLEARQTGDFSEVPADFNYKIHELLTDVGKEAYAGLFDVLSKEENYPVVFHCSHGVHRTGTASALVLSALGVRWDTIEKDYLLSNDFRKEEIDKRIDALEDMAAQNPTIEDRKSNSQNIEAFYRLMPEYIEGTKTAIEGQYGDFYTYFEALGIGESEIDKMQNILTVNKAPN